MKIFLAGAYHFVYPPKALITYKAPYILQTFFDCSGMRSNHPWSNETTESVLNACKIFLLDSGAFSFFQSGQNVNWDDYLSQYIDFINKWNIQYFFELDVDALIGSEAVYKMTERLERETGKKAIPVFHQCRGINWFKEACKRYDYVAIGASGLTAETKWTKSEKALRFLIQIAHKENTRVHGLGYTRLRNLNNTTVPFDSVDSSAWLSGSRFGTLYKFTGQTLVSRKVEGNTVHHDILDANNAQEWIKMCNYKALNDTW